MIFSQLDEFKVFGQLYINDRPVLFYQINTLNCAFVEFNPIIHEN